MITKFSKYFKTSLALWSLSLGLGSVITSANALTTSHFDQQDRVIANRQDLNSEQLANPNYQSELNVNFPYQISVDHGNFSNGSDQLVNDKAQIFILANVQVADKTASKDNKAKDSKAKDSEANKDQTSKDQAKNTKDQTKAVDPKAKDKADDKANKDTSDNKASTNPADSKDPKAASSDNANSNNNADANKTNEDNNNDDLTAVQKIQQNIDNWQKQIDELTTSKNKTLAETTKLANLQQAINFAKQALTTYQTIDQYENSLEDLKKSVELAKSDLAEEQKQLDNFHNTATNDKQLKQQSIDLNQSIEDIKAKIATLKPAETSINTLLLDNGKLLSDVNKQLNVSDLEDSTKLKLTAERDAILARNNLLKKKQVSTDLITTTNQKLTNLYNQQIVLVQKQLEAVNQAYQQQELAQKQAEINKNPILAAENIINESLKAKITSLTQLQADLQATLAKRNQQLSDAQNVSSTIDSQIKLLQGTLELNRLINEQKTLLPNINNEVDYSKDIIDWRVISFQLQAQLQKIKSEKDYIQNISPASLINSLQTLAPSSNSVSTILQIQEQASNISDYTKKQLVPILTSRKDMLVKIIGIYTNIIDVTTKIDSAQTNINAIIKSINDKLNQQDFFVRSTPPVTTNWIKSFTYSARVQFSGLSEKFTLKVGNIEIYIFGIILLIIGWITSRQKRWINFNLDKLRDRINIRNKDHILVTPSAILLTFIRTLDRPFLWGGLILLVTNSIFVDQSYIYDYFSLIIAFILVYNFTVALVLRGGIVNCHYSPEGSFYAKIANNDADLLNETTVVPQPRVKAFPTKIFASSRTVQLIDFTFTAERKAYLKRVELNSGFEPVDEDHSLYVSPKEKQFEKARKERLEHEAKLQQKRLEEEQKANEKLLAEELAKLEAEEKAQAEAEEKAKAEAKTMQLAQTEQENLEQAQVISVNTTLNNTNLVIRDGTNATVLVTNATLDSTANVVNSSVVNASLVNVSTANLDNVTTAHLSNSTVTSHNTTLNASVVTQNISINNNSNNSNSTNIIDNNIDTTNSTAEFTNSNSYAKLTVDPALVTNQTQLKPNVDNSITPDGLRNEVVTITEPQVTTSHDQDLTQFNVDLNTTTLANNVDTRYNNSNNADLVSDDDGYSEIPTNYVQPVSKLSNIRLEPIKPLNKVHVVKAPDKNPDEGELEHKNADSAQSKAQIDYQRQRSQLEHKPTAQEEAKRKATRLEHARANAPTLGELDDADKHLLDEISKDLAKAYKPFPIYSVDQASDGFITDNDEFERACELSSHFVANQTVTQITNDTITLANSTQANITAQPFFNKVKTGRKAKKAKQRVCLSADLSEEIQAKASRDLNYQLSPNANQDAQAQVYDYQKVSRRSKGHFDDKFSSNSNFSSNPDVNSKDKNPRVRVRNEVPQPTLYKGIDETLVVNMPGAPEYIKEKYHPDNSELVSSITNPDLEQVTNDPNKNLILGTHLDKEGNIRDIHGNILLSKEQVLSQQQDGGNIDLDINNVNNNLNPNQNPTVDQAKVHKLSDEEINRQEKVWSSTPKDKYHYTEDGNKTDQVDKILECDKYFNLSDAPVHDQFKRIAEISDDLQYLFTHTKWILLFLVNIIFFNIHPGVSPSENIFGQSLYLISMVVLIVTVLAFARAYLKRRARRLEEINTKIKLFWWVITMIPIIFFVLVFEGYVNTTNILLDHALYSFYALVIAFIFWRIIQRTFAIFSINIAAKNSKQTVTANDSAKSNDSHHITNIYEEQRRTQQDHHNAQRASYFDNFIGLNKLSNVVSAIILITVLLFVWSDLISIISYLNNITVWKVEGPTPGTTSDITLFSIFNSLLTIFITVIIYKNLKPLLDVLLFSRMKMAEGLPYAIETVLSYLVIALGFASSFSSLGLSWSKLQWLFSALLVGLGFGLQEIFANFVSGIIILFERPIRINDFVTINDVTGSIKKIRIRATTIIDPDNKEVIIPNKTFVTGQFINWSLSDTRTRLVYNIGVAYGSDIDLVTMTLLEAAEMCPLVIHEPNPPSCYFMEFGASSLNFVLRVHVKMLADRLITIHEINRNINNLCNERNINITFNQLDVFIKNGSGIDVKIDSSDLRTTNDTAQAATQHQNKPKASNESTTQLKKATKSNNSKK